MENRRISGDVVESVGLGEEIVHLSRLALAGREQDVRAYVLRISRKLRKSSPELAERLVGMIGEGVTRQSPLRGGTVATVPVDNDTRLQLLRLETPPILQRPPVFTADIARKLDRIVLEHGKSSELFRQGLFPTRTVILTGPPGVGKTMTARWFADRLGKPLLTLDLSAVMSSFLGRTGTNVRHVLDYAKGVSCVLFLDELDAIAKRRDDAHEVGELKRLVTVLLQEIDDWPVGGLLVAATNHSELLDPAVWRRFEAKIDFPLPDETRIRSIVERQLADTECSDDTWLKILTVLFRGFSFSDIDRDLLTCKREALVMGVPLAESFSALIKSHTAGIGTAGKRELAKGLMATGFSQRRISEITGYSRDFLRKWTEDETSTTESQ